MNISGATSGSKLPDPFTKVDWKRQEAVDRENERPDGYQTQREPVKKSWKLKVDDIAELQSQRLVVDVTAAAATIDRLNRDLLEGKYDLHRLQRQAPPLDAKAKENEGDEAKLGIKREEVCRLVKDIEEETAACEIEAAATRRRNTAGIGKDIDKSYQALCFARLQARTLR
jgi:hypothetical protein